MGEKDTDKANEIFAEVFSGIKVLAEQNDPISCCIIGFYYFNGYYVEEDKVEAVKWWKKSAEEKYAVAQYNLGVCYDNGYYVEENKVEAVKWYRKAAEQGYASAQYNLGICYDRGEGIEENRTEAAKWYRKAAEQGYVSAQYNLGICYDRGEGVEEDKAEAVKWYKKAAEQGIADAQYNLGYCYDNGERVPMVKACEIELGRIFFDRFLEYLQKNNISPKDFNPETQKFVVEDKLVKKPEEYNSDEKYFYYRVEKTTDGGIYTYVSPDKTGVFTLGGIDKYAGITKGQSFEPVIDRTNFIFGKNGVERIQSKQKYGRIKNVITVDKHILAFMDQVFTDAAFCGDDREEQIKKYLYSLSTRVRDMAFKLRNPASHTGVMPYWKALYCANMVIMVDRILYEFICKLKPEYTV